MEIVRAVLNEPEILFLDEPTSSLVEREVEWLFGLVRDLRARGVAIVFTSHRWREVVSIADRITIFRNGRQVGTYTEIDEDQAVALMAGRKVETLHPPLPPAPAGETALEVAGLAGHGLAGVSLTLGKGEILRCRRSRRPRSPRAVLHALRRDEVVRGHSQGGRAGWCGFARRGTRLVPASASRSSRKIARPRAFCCRCRSRST